MDGSLAHNARTMRRRVAPIVLPFLGMLLIGTVEGGAKYQPKIDPANFQARVNHCYFPLVPGTHFRYLNSAFGENLEREVAVTSETKTILGVRCIMLHEIISAKGAVKEDNRTWYAQDKQGNVWFFAELTTEMRPLGPSTAGSWEAGVKGAQPGIVMPAVAKPGPAYRQNYYANGSEDMGQILSAGETVTVPFGTFRNCLCTREWSLLESGGEKRWYAPEVGFIRSETIGETVELVSIVHQRLRPSRR